MTEERLLAVVNDYGVTTAGDWPALIASRDSPHGTYWTLLRLARKRLIQADHMFGHSWYNRCGRKFRRVKQGTNA